MDKTVEDLLIDGWDEDVAYTTYLLETQPELYFTDPLFFLHATAVLARGETFFDSIPTPSSVELCVAFKKIKILLESHSYQFSEAVQEVIVELLIQDGIQTNLPPFNFLDPSNFSGTDEELTNNQRKAFDAIFN